MSIGKSSQTHVRILTARLVPAENHHTPFMSGAPVTGAALPVSADGGTGGDTGTSGNIVARTNRFDVGPA
jgi:hypothetical protein